MEKGGALMPENKNENCPCKSVNCPRHGKCNECSSHHEKNGGLSSCKR